MKRREAIISEPVWRPGLAELAGTRASGAQNRAIRRFRVICSVNKVEWDVLNKNAQHRARQVIFKPARRWRPLRLLSRMYKCHVETRRSLCAARLEFSLIIQKSFTCTNDRASACEEIVRGRFVRQIDVAGARKGTRIVSQGGDGSGASSTYAGCLSFQDVKND